MQTFINHARLFPQRIGAHAERFAALARGQQPTVMFVSCSDSRVMPALFTGAGPGDIFELRTAGNIVPPSGTSGDYAIAATLEYAVEVLGVTDLVICGHTHCGAVRALTDPSSLTRLPFVQRWLQHAAAELTTTGPWADDCGRMQAAAEQHLVRQLAHAQTYPFIERRLPAGTLRLHGWLYAIDTGHMTRYRCEDGRFEAL